VSEPVDTVTRIYAGFNERDFDACRALLAPEIEWIVLDLSLRPRRLHGRDNVIAFFEGLLAPLAEIELQLVRADEVGDFVVASVDHRGRATTGAPQTSQVLHHLWRVSDGQAHAFRLYLDHGRARRSARARNAAVGRSLEAAR
jgi:ketosteroid isomerase-like protein